MSMRTADPIPTDATDRVLDLFFPLSGPHGSDDRRTTTTDTRR